MTLALYVLGALLLAVLSGFVAVALVLDDEEWREMSDGWMRGQGWWRR